MPWFLLALFAVFQLDFAQGCSANLWASPNTRRLPQSRSLEILTSFCNGKKISYVKSTGSLYLRRQSKADSSVFPRQDELPRTVWRLFSLISSRLVNFCETKGRNLGQWVRAPNWFAPSQFAPKIFGEHDIDVRVEACGVCGSDVHTLTGGWGQAKFPLCVGHEIVGEVVRVGENVKEFNVGDRAGIGAQVWACLDCEICKSDNENYCPHQVGE